MRGSPETMIILSAKTPRAATAALAQHPDAVALAGGTDFMVSWNAGLLNGRKVLDLSGIATWKTIRRQGGSLRLGALATHAQIQRNQALRKGSPLLVQACSLTGAVAIQNRGTLGGNIAIASP